MSEKSYQIENSDKSYYQIQRNKSVEHKAYNQPYKYTPRPDDKYREHKAHNQTYKYTPRPDDKPYSQQQKDRYNDSYKQQQKINYENPRM